MQKKSKIKRIKRIFKISIAFGFALLLIILGFFVKHNYTFENSNMKKWLTLSEQQQISTLKRVISNLDNQELLIQCVTKIAMLPDSEEMDIGDAAVLCYNGIKINEKHDKE